MPNRDLSEDSRNTVRRLCFENALIDVNESNLQPIMNGYQFTGLYRGMKRKDRRNLARAYATRRWKELQKLKQQR